MPSRILRLWNPTASAWEEVGDSRLSTHLAAADPHSQYVLETLADAKGDLVAASAADTLARLAVGTDGQVLTADSAQSLGVRWATAAGGYTDPLTTKGDLVARSTVTTRLGVGTDGQVLTADSAQTLGVRWATPTGGGMTDPTTTKGDLIARGASAPATRLAIGTDGQVLTADATQTLGLRWATPASGGGAFVDETGDTMSGTLTFLGAAVDTGGAIKIAGSGTETYARVIGPSTTWAPGTLSSGFGELGIRFHATVATSLELVRWYRIGSGQTAPTRVALWDTTSTAAPVWTATPPGSWTSDTTVGWKELHLASGSRPSLVAGREYRVSFSTGITSLAQASGFTATPEAPLVYDGCCETGSTGSYPGPGTTNYGIDAGVAVPASGTVAATTGMVRLANGTPGTIAWRNAGNTADLALTVSSADALTFGGSPLQTQTTADARYLQSTTASTTYLALAGGTLVGDLVLSEATPSVGLKLAADTQPRSRLTDTALAFGPGGSTAPDTTLQRTGAGALRVDTNVGVGVTPAAWRSDLRALQVGSRAAVMDDATGGVYVMSNLFVDAGGFKAIQTGGSSRFLVTGGLSYSTAPSVSGGAAATLTERLAVAPTGTLTLTPDAGQSALVAQGNVGVGVTPAAWRSDLRAVQTNTTGAIMSDAGTNFFLLNNSYWDSGGTKALTANPAAQLAFSGGTVTIQNAPSVGAGAAQTFTTRAQIAQNGTLTLSPDAGVTGIAFGTAAAPAITHPTNLSLAPTGGIVHPSTDNTVACGWTSNRWTAVYATNGTIQTSAADQKTDVTPLDPATAMAAVRATTPCTFDYLAPERSAEWYELPDDPEQAAAVLEQRLVAGPLEAGARHQAGVVLGDPAFPCDPLFQTGTGQTSPSNGVGVLIAALQSLDQRLTALGG